MILSRIQNRALNKLINSGEWLSAYKLQESMATLNSLVKKGLVIKRMGPGSFWSPRTGVEYKAKVRRVH